MGAIKQANGHPGDLLRDCDLVKLQTIRRTIDENLRVEIARMIRANRKDLLGARARRKLLAALD